MSDGRRRNEVGVHYVLEGEIFYIFDGMSIYIFVGVKLFVDVENLFVDGEKFHVCSVGVRVESIGRRLFDDGGKDAGIDGVGRRKLVDIVDCGSDGRRNNRAGIYFGVV